MYLKYNLKFLLIFIFNQWNLGNYKYLATYSSSCAQCWTWVCCIRWLELKVPALVMTKAVYILGKRQKSVTPMGTIYDTGLNHTLLYYWWLWYTLPGDSCSVSTSDQRLGQAYLTLGKTTACKATCHIIVSWVPAPPVCLHLLAETVLGGGEWWPKCLDPWHPNGKTRWISGPLALAWSNAGMREVANRWAVSVSLALSLK